MAMKKYLLVLATFCLCLAMTASTAAAAENSIWHENDPMNQLMSGNWFSAIVFVYTQTLGPVFHALVFLLGPVLIGVKYQSMVPVSMAILVSGIVFASFFPADMQFLFSIAAILGLAGILYGVVHK